MSQPSPYQFEFQKVRLVLLMEKENFSNEYRQIKLTKEGFKKLSDLLWEILPREKVGDREAVRFPLVAGDIKLPDTLLDFYNDIEKP